MAVAVIFIDSDVAIDLPAEREHYADAAVLFELIDCGNVKERTTPVVLANIEHIVTEYSNRSKARRALRALLKRISVPTMDRSTVQMTVDSAFPVFEAAMQHYAAENSADVMISTRTATPGSGADGLGVRGTRLQQIRRELHPAQVCKRIFDRNQWQVNGESSMKTTWIASMI